MRIKPWSSLGHWEPPLSRGHDELCNGSVSVAIPFVGGVTLTRERHRAEDGIWYTAGASGREDGYVVDVVNGDVVAAIALEPDEAAVVLREDGCWKLWTDAEVAARAHRYEVYRPASVDLDEVDAATAWAALGR